MLLLYGCIGYGLLCATMAACRVFVGSTAPWPASAGARAEGTGDPIAIAVSTVLSLHLVNALVRLGQPALAWLVPGCILTGVAGGLIVSRGASRISALRVPATWDRLNAALLAIGLVIAAASDEVRPASWYVAGVLVVLSLTAWRTFRRRPHGGQWSFAIRSNVGLLLAIVLLAPAVSALDGLRHGPQVPSAGPLNVVLISVDTLRRDRLGPYGYLGAHTPRVDALARDSALFEQATSAIPLTGPSHITMLTGLYPVHHGASANGVPMTAGVVTAADVLARAGYRTAAFVSGWTLKDTVTGLARRFDRYDEDFAQWRGFPDILLQLAGTELAAHACSAVGHKIERTERPAGRTTERALAWLSRHRDRPFLAFVHYFDPHRPYDPPAPYDTFDTLEGGVRLPPFGYLLPLSVRQRILSNPRYVEHIKALYDGEIAYTDAEVGRLLDGLQTLGLADHTLVIFTSDHGESLTEHDFYFDHGEYLYDTCVRVPLMIRFPDRRYAGTRWAAQVRLVDLAPTILETVGLKSPALDGRSLLPLLSGAEPAVDRVAFGSIHGGNGEDVHARYYVRERGYKLIWNFDRRQELSDQPALEELYDLNADPGELHNLASGGPPALVQLRDDLRTWMRETPRRATAPARDAGVDERLRALGYQ